LETIKTIKVKLYPNKHMKQVLDSICDYRRCCWNQGLETWNQMYDLHCIDKSYKTPNERAVRNELVENKQDWQYKYSSRVLQQAILDLGNAWQHFLSKSQFDWGKPKFKTKKDTKQGFKSDRIKLVNDKIRLDKPHQVKEKWQDIKTKGCKNFPNGELTVVSITKTNGKYYASLPFKITVDSKTLTGKKTAIDVNVGHFNYTDGNLNVLPKKLNFYYSRIKHYQKMLAKKRVTNGKNACKSNNYLKVRTKLQRDYEKASNLTNDILHKFSTQLVNNYDTIVIEDLDVKHMQMSHVASKGLQRSCFGLFRQLLTYKCNWYGKELIIADRFYPSTQRCSCCGHIKTGEDKITLSGNKKHNTKHNEYACYECGFTADRDYNAVMNLLALAN
jgi:putative transposase